MLARPDEGQTRSVLGRWAPALAVLVIAFVTRLAMVYAHGGNLHGSPSYDTSVYYAAADALLHGRMPYRDFTLVHPPGSMLAMTPFAAFGRLTSDHIGFMAGSLAWMVLGAVNSVLVLRISRRLGLPTAAGVIGGLSYALWYESARTEYALRLEPLGNAFLLLGMLALARPTRSWNRLVPVLGGAALGVSASVKIWYVVPMLVVLAWQFLDRDRPRDGVLWSVAGAAAGLLVVNGPFFLIARARMWHLIVTDQFGRTYVGTPVRRLAQLSSSGQIGDSSSTAAVVAVTLAGAVLFAVFGLLAWQSRVEQSRVGRLFVVLAAVQIAVMLAAPTYFPYYSDFLAPALSLMLATAAGTLIERNRSRVPVRRLRAGLAVLPVVIFAASTLAIDTLKPLSSVKPAPTHTLQRVVASARCVQSDSPMALIQLDVLSRDLAHGCKQWVDVIGRLYSPPLKPHGTDANGRPYGRKTYPPWQAAIRRYLLSGDAVVVLDPNAAGISRRTVRRVTRGAVLGRSGDYVVHSTRPRP